MIHDPVQMPPTLPGDNSYDQYAFLLDGARGKEAITTAVIHPCDAVSLVGAIEAAEAGLIAPVLVGPAAKVQAVAAKAGLDIAPYRLIDAPHSHAAAQRAVELVRAGEAEALMKGSLHSDELLGAVIHPATGLRTERRVSHSFLLDVPTYPKPLIITDAAVNIAPDMKTKRDIIQNAIDLAHAIGISTPKVALLAAVEVVNPEMPATTDAACLCKMAERGQITGGVLDGPLAMDNAINLSAAQTKGIVSEVAGQADVLVVPNLEAGNILAKQLIFLARAEAAGIVMGAQVPIVFFSRADSVRTRMASCALAVLVAHHRRAHQVEVQP